MQNQTLLLNVVMPDHMHTDQKPPIGRAVIIPHDESPTEEGLASLRTSVCDQQYVSQINRIYSHQGNVFLRVNSKYEDD